MDETTPKRGRPFQVKEDTVNETEAPTVSESDVVNVDRATLNTLLDTLKKQEDRLSKIENKEAPKINKDKYQGPYQYRYKLYARNVGNVEELVPILSYRSIKENPKEGLVYRNVNNTYQNNHYVVMTLADKTEVKESVMTLLSSKVSEFEFPTYVETESGTLIKGDSIDAAKVVAVAYHFTTPLYGTFRVLANVIN